MKSRPRTIEEVDLELEEAIEQFRRACKRVRHGQGVVRVTKHQDLVIEKHVALDDMTPIDIERLMTARPKRRRGVPVHPNAGRRS